MVSTHGRLPTGCEVDLNRQLHEIASELEAASRRLERLVESSEADAWERDPASGGWSAARCVAHLNLTAEATLPQLRSALAVLAERGEAAPARLRRDPVGWLLWRTQREGGGFRTPTRPGFEPGAEQERSAVLERFHVLQDELLEIVRQADGLPLGKVKITSPFDARVRYNVYSALSILAAHEHRHLAQAERALGRAKP